MRKALLYIVLLFLSACSAPEQSSGPDSTLIYNVSLFDGDELKENSAVLIKEGVVKILSNDNLPSDGKVVKIDGSGKTLTPGLINSHVHAFEGGHLTEAAKSGVLTLLDMFNNSIENVDELKSLEDDPYHSYLLSAGPTVTVPGGHGTQFGFVPTVKSAADIPNFIQERFEEGSDYIKIIKESGPDNDPIPTASLDIIEAAATRAKELNLLSVVHISRRSDAVAVANLGVDGLVHIWRRDTTPISEEEIEQLKNSGIFIIPTLKVRKSAADFHGVIDMELLMSDLAKLYEAGVPILAGTDPPNFDINYGSDLHEEIILLTKAGLSNEDAIKAATSVASDYFNLNEKGRIIDGGPADLVLINGDPFTRIEDIRNVEMVWKQGVRIRP